MIQDEHEEYDDADGEDGVFNGKNDTSYWGEGRLWLMTSCKKLEKHKSKTVALFSNFHSSSPSSSLFLHDCHPPDLLIPPSHHVTSPYPYTHLSSNSVPVLLSRPSDRLWPPNDYSMTILIQLIYYDTIADSSMTCYLFNSFWSWWWLTRIRALLQ